MLHAVSGILQSMEMIALLAADCGGEAAAEGAEKQSDEKPVERMGDGFASGISRLLFGSENLVDALIRRGAGQAGALRDGSSDITLIFRGEFAPHEGVGKNQADFGAQGFVGRSGDFIAAKKAVNEIAIGIDDGVFAARICDEASQHSAEGCVPNSDPIVEGVVQVGNDYGNDLLHLTIQVTGI